VGIVALVVVVVVVALWWRCGGCETAILRPLRGGGTGSHGRVDAHDHDLVDADHDADDAVPSQPAGAAGQSERGDQCG
jgi:hypothetical protein